MAIATAYLQRNTKCRMPYRRKYRQNPDVQETKWKIQKERRRRIKKKWKETKPSTNSIVQYYFSCITCTNYSAEPFPFVRPYRIHNAAERTMSIYRSIAIRLAAKS